VTVELTAERPVAGGAMLGHEESGRVVLVRDAVPGERVRVRLDVERPRSAEGSVVEVLSPAAERVEPPCRHVADGCGGCDWQYGELAAQQRWRVAIVEDALRRLGHLEAPVVRAGPGVPSEGYRTTLRLSVTGEGRLGLHRRRADSSVPVPGCLVAHPLLRDLLDLRFPGAREVVVRAGVATGERLVVVAPKRVPATLPDDVVVVGRDELRGGRRVWFHEEAAGRNWRISAESFFQSGPAAAEALVGAVTAAAGEGGDRLVELYGGVGLFAGTVGVGRHTTLVERGRSAVADARVNLAGDDVRIIRIDVRRFRPVPADVVVADPPRSGLGAEAVAVTAGCHAPVVVLVSCDAAALGRDVALLAGHGYRHVETAVVDAFPHTAQVETVTRLERG
jgi:23S rRNA (uracil1939-C5)-methyltransferase